jgi:PPOX class probable F420-dependent enzyme
VNELSEAARAFLDEMRYGVAATLRKDGTPRLFVMWYDVWGNRVVMNTTAHTAKIRDLRRKPYLTFCVEDGEKYVTIEGPVELEFDLERARADKKALAIRYFGPEKAEQMAREVYSKQERVTIYVTPVKVYEHL